MTRRQPSFALVARFAPKRATLGPGASGARGGPNRLGKPAPLSAGLDEPKDEWAQ